MDKVCEFEGCGKPVKARGLCNGHYSQLTRHGTLKPISDRLPKWTTLEERLNFYLDKSGDCWLWIGSKNQNGYGQVNLGGSKKAHRTAYETWVGPIPDGSVVHHKCANKLCCKPEHLQLTTQYDNTAEMLGRRTYEARIAALEAEVAKLKAQLEAVRGHS